MPMQPPQLRSPRRTIRFWLNCLVVACVLPAALVATLIIERSYMQARASLERDTIETARALMQAVDVELTSARSALQILALSNNLTTGRLSAFYQRAQEVVRGIDGTNIV